MQVHNKKEKPLRWIDVVVSLFPRSRTKSQSVIKQEQANFLQRWLLALQNQLATFIKPWEMLKVKLEKRTSSFVHAFLYSYYAITMFGVENLYPEHVCKAVIWPSHWSYIVQKLVTGEVAETETPFTLLHKFVPSKWFKWKSYCCFYQLIINMITGDHPNHPTCLGKGQMTRWMRYDGRMAQTQEFCWNRTTQPVARKMAMLWCTTVFFLFFFKNVFRHKVLVRGSATLGKFSHSQWTK